MFSIIIPCFEDVDLLDKVLAGFVHQTFDQDFELILVDNNTVHDSIAEMHRKYRDLLELTLVLRSRLDHPMAPCSARNIGMKLARHPWIINIDSDCIPCGNYLSQLAAFIEASPTSNLLITGLREFVDSADVDSRNIMTGLDLDSLPRVLSPSNYNLLLDRRLPEILSLDESDHPWSYFHSCNMTYPRSVAMSIGGYDEAFDGCWGYEDTDFAFRMIQVGGARGIFLPGIQCYHQDSTRSKVVDRGNKRDNRNWKLISERIPGIHDYKKRKYLTVAPSEIVL